MEEPEFDLYDEATFQPLTKDITKEQAEKQAKISIEKELRESINKLEKKVEELKESKDHYLMNWSSFSITARRELERKDQQLKDKQRELDSLVFRRNKSSFKPRIAETVEVGTQTEEFPSRDGHNGSRRQEKISSCTSSHSSRRSPEKARSKREKEKISTYNRSSSKKHEENFSSSKERELERNRKRQQEKNRSQDRSPSFSIKNMSEKSRDRERHEKKTPEKSRKRAYSKSPRKHNSTNEKRSKDKEIDLRKLLLMKKANENGRKLENEIEPKKMHATRKVSNSISQDSSNLVCINSSDSDEVVIVTKTPSVEVSQASNKTLTSVQQVFQDPISQVVEEPMEIDEPSEPSIETQKNVELSTEKSIDVNATEYSSPSPSISKNAMEISEEQSKEKVVTVEISESVITQELPELMVDELHREVPNYEIKHTLDEAAETISSLVYLPFDKTLLEILQNKDESKNMNLKEISDPVTKKPQVGDKIEDVVKTKGESKELLSCTNESLDSSGSKENSLNHSHENGKEYKSKRLSYTKDVQEDGETVVLTILRPTRTQKKKKSKVSL